MATSRQLTSTSSEKKKLPNKSAIALRAYEIYVENGRQDGYDLDNWLQAEYELLQLPLDALGTLTLPAKPSKKHHNSKSILDIAQALVL